MIPKQAPLGAKDFGLGKIFVQRLRRNCYRLMTTTIGAISQAVFVGLSKHGRTIALKDDEIQFHRERDSLLKVLPYLTPAAIRGNDVSFEELDTVTIASQNYSRYCVRPGDILVVCRGTQIRSAVVPPNAPECVIASSFIAIRLKPSSLDPVLLSTHLNDTRVINLILRKSNASSASQSISVKNIQDVLIRVPPQDVQRELRQICDVAAAHHKLSIDVAEAVSQQARTEVSFRLLAE